MTAMIDKEKEIWQRKKKSSKIEQDQKYLISSFA